MRAWKPAAISQTVRIILNSRFCKCEPVNLDSAWVISTVTETAFHFWR